MEDEITQFAYDQMVEHALRGVVREALSVTQTHGLPGANHFYITFRTDHPGALVSSRLKAVHPHAMTIVLQNQFWDLTVCDESFGVTLSFSGRREHLTVPFDSITAFVDPHASFGLQFHVMLSDGQVVDDDDGEENLTAPEEKVRKDQTRRDALEVLSGDSDSLGGKIHPTMVHRALSPKPEPDEGPDDPDDTDPGGNVVTLDRFRKKH